MKFDLKFLGWQKKCKDGSGKQLCANFGYGSYTLSLSYEEVCDHASRRENQTHLESAELEKALQNYPDLPCIASKFNKKGVNQKISRIANILDFDGEVFDKADSWAVRSQKSLCPEADQSAA